MVSRALVYSGMVFMTFLIPALKAFVMRFPANVARADFLKSANDLWAALRPGENPSTIDNFTGTPKLIAIYVYNLPKLFFSALEYSVSHLLQYLTREKLISDNSAIFEKLDRAASFPAMMSSFPIPIKKRLPAPPLRGSLRFPFC